MKQCMYMCPSLNRSDTNTQHPLLLPGLDAQGHNRSEIIRRLTADSVKKHGNKRIGDTSSTGHSHGSLPEGGLQAVLAQGGHHVVSVE